MKHLVSLFFLFFYISASCQSDDYFIIEDVVYIGNKRTKGHVIDKELEAKIGDTVFLDGLTKWKKYNEKRVLGTALFTKVDLNIVDWDFERKKAVIEITVRENWYLYPLLILDVADRSFNVWLLEEDKDFSRLNYGLALEHINLTGNKDKLKLKAQRGYTNKYEIFYEYPYLADRLGLNFEISYADYDEIGYRTFQNKTLFGSSPEKDIMLTRFRVGNELTYRQNAKIYHGLKLTYHHNTINSYVVENLTDVYFNDGDLDLQMFTVDYRFTYDNRLFNFYPTGGWLAGLELSKEGLGVFNNYNNIRLKAEYQYFKSLSNKLTTGVRLVGSTKLNRDNIPFANNTGLGYEDDLVRGYELYVMDGSDFVLGKFTTRYKIFERTVNYKKMMPIPQFRLMPLEVNLRFNIETGYVNEERYIVSNDLNNRWVVGYGPGVDIIIYNTFMFSVEYNFNQEGESGLFFKGSSNF